MNRARELSRDKGAYQMLVTRAVTNYKIYAAVRGSVVVLSVIFNKKVFR